MHNLLALLFVLLGGIFQIIGAVIQVSFMALIAVLAAPFAFILFIYHLFVENKKD